MDSTQTSAANKRMSAIPRISKLPVLNNPRSAVGSSGIAPSQQHKEDPLTLLENGVSSIPKAPTTTSRLAKRSSIAYLPRSTASPAKAPSAAGSSIAPRMVSNGSSQNIRPSGTTKSALPPPGQAKRQLSHRSSMLFDAGENADDRLGSLDSFRSVPSGTSRGRIPSLPQDTNDAEEPTKPRSQKSSRPSLSDRTIESLNAMPTTPKERRQSDFFSPGESPMSAVPRPLSSLSRNGSVASRPGTSDGPFVKPPTRLASPSKKLSASAKPATRTSLTKQPSLSSLAAGRRSTSSSFTSKLHEAKTGVQPATRSVSPVKEGPLTKDLVGKSGSSLTVPKPNNGSRVSRSKSPKPKPTLQPAFAPSRNETSDEPSPEHETRRIVSSSSTALRQQIAAAKAAARKEKAKHDSPQDGRANTTTSFEIEMHADPFNGAPKDNNHILKNRINNARTDGRLNIAAMGLKEIPTEVLKMYDAKAMEESNVNWAEVVDLTRFIAADNELEDFDETIFPDRSIDELDADDTADGNQFGGLELLDLHGNLLSLVPSGLRRLERLTSLNLAHNKLENTAFDILAQISSLKELRLGNNAIGGNLPTSICTLPHLEVLDLQSNRLLGLPEALRDLVNLKVLNVSGNQLTILPMDSIEQLPLVDLDASNNLLIASLFPLGGSNGHPTLQALNVANNSLAALTFVETLDLPQLRSLNVTNNHLTVIPSIAECRELLTLAVGDNKIAQFPHGFTKLQKLRNVNFASNEIRLVDTDICYMSGLETLILAANPLREKKFLNMNAGDIKRELKARLTPSDMGDEDDIPASPVTVIGASDTPDTPTSSWSMKANGVLDLVARNLSDDVNDILGSFLQRNEVRDLALCNNKLTCIPPALWLGQDLRTLDLSDNTLNATDYLSDELSLPVLQELNLSRCRLLSLESLLTQLQAPTLRSLNICANRLAGAVPPLKPAFPQLSTFLASDNKFDVLSADAIRGVANVSLASNNIAQLPAELGLLWDEGLRHLDVSSNAFRVPNYRILERGTEATLRWLRNKLPADGRTAIEELE